MAFVEPVTLRDRGIRLEPLALSHEHGLAAAAADALAMRMFLTSDCIVIGTGARGRGAAFSS